MLHQNMVRGNRAAQGGATHAPGGGGASPVEGGPAPAEDGVAPAEGGPAAAEGAGLSHQELRVCQHLMGVILGSSMKQARLALRMVVEVLVLLVPPQVQQIEPTVTLSLQQAQLSSTAFANPTPPPVLGARGARSLTFEEYLAYMNRRRT
ncbi:hypothetical protein CYMTET_40609 [Cymbomonas tetramitiformis]|uniref:Uncharacterized protein n=1 Tax=Cymbomonas tetramitiformis TaxID=36881 RepID=A0AAE0C7R1_9CHLO|nr:hypothetical protein CYMTET_40609 [Cymbomonas tetramitiformis]